MDSTLTRLLYPSLSARTGRGVTWLRPLRAWHLLSLDAPSVAVAWLLLLHPAAGWHDRLLEAAALAVAVWLLYAGDRVLDASRANTEMLQSRHRFHARHRRRFGAAAACALPLLAWLVVHLPPTVRLAWLSLAVPMALYALVIHGWPVRRMPKELVVSLMFATATALPALVTTPNQRGHALVLGALFAAVCWLNCVAIARWEADTSCSMGVVSTAWGARHLRALCAVLSCGGVLLAVPLGPVAPACGLSAALLLLLDVMHRRLDAVALRAFADGALLTPLLFLFAR